MAHLKFDVSGMTCGGCGRSVEMIIQKQDAASKVTVDLASGRVEAETSADPTAVAAALTAAGFPAKQTAA